MKYIRFNKLRIALDVDSVLADVIIHWNRIYYDIYNRKLKKFDINTWDFWKKLNLNNQQFNEIFTKTDMANLFKMISTYTNGPPSGANTIHNQNKYDLLFKVIEKGTNKDRLPTLTFFTSTKLFKFNNVFLFY